jgi:4-hydroxymandelate oxidase
MITLADVEARAREVMDPAAFGYYAGGAGDEITLAANRAALEQIFLRPRVLVDVANVDTALTLFGDRLSMPVLIAPTAFHRLAHPEGECATARAAAALGTAMIVSTLATRTLEEIAASSPGPRWFQLYFYRDRALTAELIQRAEAAGFRALVLTADTPRLGQRERDLRSGFQLPDDVRMANFEARHPLMARVESQRLERTLVNYANEMLNPSLTWDDVTWLASVTRMPLVLKGVLTAEDARRAVTSGVRGIVVSNHGGRQLDGAVATARALPEVVDAAAGQVPVLMDGGIRRGVDVLRALGLGATAVLVGRPILWGLAAGGEAGVTRVLEILRNELEAAMALSGRPTLAGIDRSLIAT